VNAVAARTTGAFGDALTEARRAWRWPATLATAAFVVALFAPLVLSRIQMQELAAWLYLSLAAIGLAFAVGLAGMPSLCEGAFMAVGAFTAAQLRSKAGADPVSATIAGAALATAAGALLGIAFVRLGRVLFAVATWLVAWLVALSLAAFPELSGGARGLPIRAGAFTETIHYELALVLVALAALVFFAIARGAPGLALAALRVRPPAARVLGVPATRLRLGAFVASAGIGGLAGALAVQLAGIADPAGYGPFLSFKLFAAVLLGGAATALGPLAGLAAISALFHIAHWIGDLENVSTTRFEPMIAAALLLFVLGIGGGGIVPWLRRFVPARTAAIEASPAPPPRRFAGATFAAAGIRKSFGGLAALVDLSLTAEPGTIVALIGPNGSGKTTALRIFSGTLVSDGGRLTLDGAPLIADTTTERVRSGVARTLQRTAVFDELTALENVLVGAGLERGYGGAIRSALATPKERAETERLRGEALDILDLVGLRAAASTPAAHLSSSDQRLTMLAAALATRPRVLLLDEPAAGGSAEDVARLARLLDALRGDGLTIVLVEHNLRLVSAVAERVVVLDGGRTIADGPPAEVAREPTVRDAYLGTHRL